MNIRLHLGCGKWDFGPSWIHIDKADFPHIVSHDVEHLDFESGTVAEIYASHLLTYFDWEEAKVVLGEWYRVLRDDGILRIAVTDFSALADLYLNGLRHVGLHPDGIVYEGHNRTYTLPHLECRFRVGLECLVGPLFGRMQVNDRWIYHKAPYDFDKLKELLESVGFSNVHRVDWRHQFDDQSNAYFPSADPVNRILISLNVEAIK